MPSRSPEAIWRYGRPRFEQKFLVELSALDALLERFAPHLRQDPHAGSAGGYTVSSLYYDTPDHRCYFEKLDGTDPRFKIRARSYARGAASSERPPVFLEAKYRRGAKVAKVRASLTDSEVATLRETRGLSLPLQSTDPRMDLLHDLTTRDAFLRAVALRYERRAYLGAHDPSFRLTVDTSLRTLLEADFFSGEERRAELFLPAHLAVLELKFHVAMPHWILDLTRALQLHGRRYSKYAAAFEQRFPALGERQVRRASAPR